MSPSNPFAKFVEELDRAMHKIGRPRVTHTVLREYLEKAGFVDVKTVDYIPWRMALENYVMGESKDNALYVLFHLLFLFLAAR